MSRPGPHASVAALATALVMLALTVACTKSAPAPTPESYAATADRVCEQTDERLVELEEDRLVGLAEQRSEEPAAPVDPRPDRWVRSEVVPAYEDMVGRLRSIRPPDDDATYLAGIYEDLAHRIEILRLTPGGGRDVVRADEDLRSRFASYGMEVCGTV